MEGKMTKGPWKYEKAEGHHHVLMGEEALDVNSELDARAIAALPEAVELLKVLSFSPNSLRYRNLARGILQKMGVYKRVRK